MGRAEEYEAQAEECLRLARSLNHAPSKAQLLHMAPEWVKLAQSVREQEAQERYR
jgi:hypothetical protein